MSMCLLLLVGPLTVLIAIAPLLSICRFVVSKGVGFVSRVIFHSLANVLSHLMSLAAMPAATYSASAEEVAIDFTKSFGSGQHLLLE
jgi:hypothetical protein